MTYNLDIAVAIGVLLAFFMLFVCGMLYEVCKYELEELENMGGNVGFEPPKRNSKSK